MKYTVHVTFRKEFIEVTDAAIRVGVRAVPEKGKANEAVLRSIARHFNIPLLCVRLVSGKTSRRKVIEVLRHTR
mgnify:CR=1 FL=1